MGDVVKDGAWVILSIGWWMFLGGVVLVSLFWLVAVLALGAGWLWQKAKERRWRAQRGRRG